MAAKDLFLDQTKLVELNRVLKPWRRDFLVRVRMGMFNGMAQWLGGSNPEWGESRGLDRSLFRAYKFQNMEWLKGPHLEENDFIPLCSLLMENEWWRARDDMSFQTWKKRWTRFRNRYRRQLHELFEVKPPGAVMWHMRRQVWDLPQDQQGPALSVLINQWRADEPQRRELEAQAKTTP